mmetsp:Transcript_2368/g.3157  ORF Transcript_2368/g.3157 Transcript_2368/m.3157 type:complete len:334 (-) Transcript_2368:160-1161(-)
MTRTDDLNADTNDAEEITKMDMFHVLSGLDVDDFDDLDPSNFLGVATDELDVWLQESLANANDEKNAGTKVAEMGRRLSMCLGAEIQRRNSLLVGSHNPNIASRRGSTFSEFAFDASTLPQDEQDSSGDFHQTEKCSAPHSNTNEQQEQFWHSSVSSDDSRISKRRRIDHSRQVEDRPSNGGLYSASSTSSNTACTSYSSTSSTSTKSSSTSSRSSSLGSESGPANTYSFDSFVHSFLLKNQSYFGKKIEKSIDVPSLTPVVPLALTVTPGLTSSMKQSEQSMQEIHDWDRKMGLRKSHSKTMRATRRSRQELKEMEKKMWQGERKQFQAKLA